MRVLAIDFGGVHIGVAVGDSDKRVASPRSNLRSSGKLATDAQNIKSLVTAESADAVVIGLPLFRGETKLSRICRKLGEQLSLISVDVEFVDESMTSLEAEREMRSIGLKGSQQRKRVDGEAACRILERYFEQKA